MYLTKYTHSCVRVTCGDSVLVVDPGVFSETVLALDGADAVLVTHEHADHFDVKAIRNALETNPLIHVWGPGSVVEALADFPGRVTLVLPETVFDINGIPVQTFGGQHALLHANVPAVANVAYFIDRKLYHPGDSLVVPHFPLENYQVEVLLLPSCGPWLKISEVLDFLVAVKPKQAYQIHDALLNEIGVNVYEQHIQSVANRFGVDFRHLDSGEVVNI